MMGFFWKTRTKYNGIGLTSLTFLAINTYYDYIYYNPI